MSVKQGKNSIMSLGFDKSRSMLETGLLSDCQFEVKFGEKEPEIFKAHKNQLVYASDVFKDMILSTEKEDGPIIVSDISPNVFKKLLIYIYTSELELQGAQEAAALAIAANKYKIFDLKEKCIEFIKLNFDRREIWDVMLLVDALDDLSIMEVCKVVIMEHAEECLSYKAFLDMSSKVVQDILQFETMNISSELTLIRACIKWCKNNMSEEKTLRDAMLPFLPHLRLLSLKSKEFAEGPAQQDWLTVEETCLIFTFMASTSAVNKNQLACSPLTEPRKKPVFHVYSGLFCVSSSSSQTLSVPDDNLNYVLNGFQFSLQEKVMTNIYVHDIKVYTIVNNECFKKTVRTNTFKDGQNYLVTLHLTESLKLDAQLNYKMLIKIWRQPGRQESIYLTPDFQNLDLTASKQGFFLLVKCGGLFENSISKIESIIIKIDEKPKNGQQLQPSPTKSLISEIIERKTAEFIFQSSEADLEDEYDSEGNNEAEDGSDDDMEEAADELNGTSVSSTAGDLTKVFLSQIEDLREIKDPEVKNPIIKKKTKKHYSLHADEEVAQRSPNPDASRPILKRGTSLEDDDEQSENESQNHKNKKRAH